MHADYANAPPARVNEMSAAAALEFLTNNTAMAANDIIAPVN